MGWGTSYKYDGYLSRITTGEVDNKLEETNNIIDIMWREILAYMASTPPRDASDGESEYPYPEFIASKCAEFRRELEDYYDLKAHLEDCIETRKENPDDVKDT